MKLLLPVDIPRRTIVRWFLVVLSIKLSWLVLFTLLRNPNWNPSLEIGTIGLYTGDSKTYYKPLEHLIETGTYYGACRMPGLLPVYLPLRVLFSKVIAQQIIVVLQLLLESISCIALGILGARIFKSPKVFRLTALLSCLTLFVTVRNIYLLSDSFCISALILTFYFLSSYFISGKSYQLWLSAIFIAWALFLRQICIVTLPVFALMLFIHHEKNLRQTLRSAFILFLPLVLALSAWTIRNRITFDKTIILIPSLEECMNNYTPESAAIRHLIITMGEDLQPWVRNGAAYWFFNPKASDKLPSPFEDRQFTSQMQLPELEALRADYRSLDSNHTLSPQQLDSLGKSIISRANTYAASFKEEHSLQYAVWNKFLFAKMFLFPDRIDDIPFPPVAEMNVLQKGIKLWSLLSFWIANALMIIIAAVWLIQRRWQRLLWTMIPVGMTLILIVLGFVEQRYMATSFPFFLMFIAGAFCDWRLSKNPASAQLH